MSAARESLGMSKTRFYGIWIGMRNRCCSEKYKYRARYGGRGIDVSTEWSDFLVFHKDMFPSYEEGLTLDRIDNDKGYSKENCRWVDRTVQANNRRSNRRVSWNGENKTLMEWERSTGLNRNTITQRLDNGWDIEKALSSPPGYSWRRSLVGNG